LPIYLQKVFAVIAIITALKNNEKIVLSTEIVNKEINGRKHESGLMTLFKIEE